MTIMDEYVIDKRCRKLNPYFVYGLFLPFTLLHCSPDLAFFIHEFVWLLLFQMAIVLITVLHNLHHFGSLSFVSFTYLPTYIDIRYTLFLFLQMLKHLMLFDLPD